MKWKPLLFAALIALAPLSQPRPLTAQTLEGETETEAVDTSKLWDYAMCGVSIAFATGTGGWFVAAIVCGKALTEHWAK
jgi:hypothetical protein